MIPIPEPGCPWCCWFLPPLHLHEPSSRHSFSPLEKTEPFLTHRAAKPQTPHLTLFYCLSEKKYLERLKCRAASRAGHSRNLIWFICSGTFKSAPNSSTGVFIVLLKYFLLLSDLWMWLKHHLQGEERRQSSRKQGFNHEQTFQHLNQLPRESLACLWLKCLF